MTEVKWVEYTNDKGEVEMRREDHDELNQIGLEKSRTLGQVGGFGVCVVGQMHHEKPPYLREDTGFSVSLRLDWCNISIFSLSVKVLQTESPQNP